MKTNLASPSAGFFGLRLVLTFVLCLASAALSVLALAAPSQPKSKPSDERNAARAKGINWRSKVDAGILANAAAGSAEFMIYMAQKADLSGAAALTVKSAKGAYVYQKLVDLAEATQPPVRALLEQYGAEYRSFWISNTIWAKGDLALVEAIAARPEVAALQPIGQGTLAPPPNEGKSPSSPHAIQAVEPGLQLVNADDVWALGYEGQGAIIAGADTGVRFTHEALRNQYRGWGGTAETSVHDYNWHDAIHVPNWPPEPLNLCNPGGPTGAGQPSPFPCDDDEILGGGHGSHTMGSMIGDDGASNQIGMAPQARWVACRNLSNGVGIIPTYLECMQWFIAPTKIDGTNPDTTKAPDVINNSWGCLEGCPPDPNPLRDALQASRTAGIVYVASAGNDGSNCNTIFHPLARYPEAFTVGSTTHTTDMISNFSSRGPSAVDPENPNSPLYLKPDITAPGSTIRSALRASDNEYGNLSGTSMAGPHVAGLVALIISANPKLAGNVDRIEEIITQTAVPKPTIQGCGVPPDSTTAVPNNTYGWGRIDALAAVTLALAEATPVTLVDVVSRKTHGSPTAVQEIPLPLTGTIGLECRAGQPAEGEHTIVFTFTNAVANVGGASVSGGSGSVSSRAIGTDTHEYVVNLTGVGNEQTIMLTLNGVTDQTGNSTPSISVPINFLLADTNADLRVNVGDTNQTKSASGQVTTSGNFRTDPNLDGRINIGDTNFVKSRSGDCIGAGCETGPGGAEGSRLRRQ